MLSWVSPQAVCLMLGWVSPQAACWYTVPWG